MGSDTKYSYTSYLKKAAVCSSETLVFTHQNAARTGLVACCEGLIVSHISVMIRSPMKIILQILFCVCSGEDWDTPEAVHWAGAPSTGRVWL